MDENFDKKENVDCEEENCKEVEEKIEKEDYQDCSEDGQQNVAGEGTLSQEQEIREIVEEPFGIDPGDEDIFLSNVVTGECGRSCQGCTGCLIHGGYRFEEELNFDDLDEEGVVIYKREPQKKHLIKNKYLRSVCEWTLTLVVAFVIAVLICTYVVRISTVSGNSMLQTYHSGDNVVISKLPYIFGDPQYGDIIVFDSSNARFPNNYKERTFITEIKETIKYNLIAYKFFDVEPPQQYYIKRVIGAEGDTIEFKEDGIYRNGKLLQEDYVNPAFTPDYSNWIGLKVVVEKDHVFVMGDNRNHSTDSRVIGQINEKDILGKVVELF